MAFYRKSGGSNVTLTTLKRRSGGAWVNVQNVYRRASGAWVLVWTAFTATVSSSLASGFRSTTGTATTNVVTAGPAGSTYAWSQVSGDSGITIFSTSIAGPTWSANVGPGNPSRTAVWRCLVTNGSNSGYTPDVTVSLEFTG